MKSARLLLLAAALPLTACGGSQQAMGTTTSIIVLTTDSVWATIGDSVLAALEPRVFTVRDERTFEVTHVSPQDPLWHELRRFRQVLVIGTAEDGWVQPVLRRADGGASGVARAEDVWARNQLVTAIVVPPAAGPDAALQHVPAVSHAVDSTFRAGARQRMYLSGANTALRDSLRQRHGFGILLPNVYRALTRDDQVHLFQSSTQVGGDLVRSVLVTSRQGQVPLTADAALAWRDSVAATQYRPPQTTARERIEGRALTVGGMQTYEVQGIWDVADPGWPMSGPFITRVVQCPGLAYMIDAWIYGPGRAKYEYMIQLQTLMDQFECATAASGAPPAPAAQ
jgi:hypothetical protein